MWLVYHPHHLPHPSLIPSHSLNAFHPLCLLLPFLYTSSSNLLVLPFFLNNGNLIFLKSKMQVRQDEKPVHPPGQQGTLVAGHSGQYGLARTQSSSQLTEPPGASAPQPRLHVTMDKLCFPVSWETVKEMRSPRGQPPSTNSASKFLSSRISKT